jgi:hypothetical protein
MSLPTVEYNGHLFPEYQIRQKRLSSMIFPFVSECCKGTGYDITYSYECNKFPGSVLVHPSSIPHQHVDYIFSDALSFDRKWTETLNVWLSRIRKDGVIVLYIPDKKSILSFLEAEPIYHIDPRSIEHHLIKMECHPIFISGSDLNHGILIIAKK